MISKIYKKITIIIIKKKKKNKKKKLKSKINILL